jgi:hypothetical protein
VRGCTSQQAHHHIPHHSSGRQVSGCDLQSPPPTVSFSHPLPSASTASLFTTNAAGAAALHTSSGNSCTDADTPSSSFTPQPVHTQPGLGAGHQPLHHPAGHAARPSYDSGCSRAAAGTAPGLVNSTAANLVLTPYLVSSGSFVVGSSSCTTVLSAPPQHSTGHLGGGSAAASPAQPPCLQSVPLPPVCG